MKKAKDLLLAQLAASKEQSANAAALHGIDTESRAYRIGKALITTSHLMRALEMVLVLAIVMVAAAHPTFAQSPGNIFGSDPTTAGRGLIEAVKYFRNVIFVLGIVFFMWAAINLGFEKPWGMKAIGGAACWAFSGLAALVYEFSQGNSVQMDTSGLGR